MDAYIRRFHITDVVHKKKEILQHLHRMNMSNATLFPGLSGFSESLRTLFAFLPKEEGILTGHSEDVMEYFYSKEPKVPHSLRFCKRQPKAKKKQ